jgi:hypothetical protein
MKREASPVARILLRTLRWLWASPATLIGLAVGGAGLFLGGKCRCERGVLEFKGRLVAAFLRFIGRGAAAMTLGHTILGRSQEDLDRARDHEHVHVRQYERWGPLFIPAYGVCSCWLFLRGRRAYWDNPFEQEAYASDLRPHREHHDSRSCPPAGAGEWDNPGNR